jgi:hypothetical protein
MVLPSNRQLIWNEEVHTFEVIGFNRFTHYVRPVLIINMQGKAVKSTESDDKVGEPRFMTGPEVDNWIRAHTREPITFDEEREFISTWESGNFGPLDNPRADEEPKDPQPKDPWPDL